MMTRKTEGERRKADALATLADRAKAMQWLADHPELPDPGDDGQSLLFPVHPTNDTGAAVAAATPAMEE